jgi:hypothetical protein
VSYSALYAIPDAPPADGDSVASTTGWLHWTNAVLARADDHPELAHLAAHGWADRFEDLEHELEQLLHAPDGDPDLAAITAQVLAAVKARPPQAAALLVTDGEPAGDDDDTSESVEADPLAVLTEARALRRDGETWQVGSNWYTKRGGKIRKASDPAKKKPAGPLKKDVKAAAKATRADNTAKAKSAAVKLANGGAGLTDEDVVHLDDHFATLGKDQLRGVVRAIGEKLSGTKKDLAARLVARARALVAGQQEPTAPEQKPEPPPAHPAATRMIQALNAAPNLSDQQREEYGAAVARVARAMPKTALDRLARHVDATTFYASTELIGAGLVEAVATQPGLTAEQSAERRQKYGYLAQEPCGGCYMSFAGGGGINSLHLDGAQEMHGREAGKYGRAKDQSAESIYAHELTHGADGPKHEISQSAEWQAAYAAEIGQTDAERIKAVEPKLSWYGGTQPSEGLAEFGRLVYASAVPHADIARDFPRATAVFKSWGLWPESERTAPAKEALDPSGRGPALDELFARRIPIAEAGPAAHADVLLDPTDPAAVAYALAQLRADGDDEAAAELLHLIGDSDVGETASESRVREHQGAPPFPGAVFDASSHRWKNPHTGEEHPDTPDHPNEEHAAATALHDAAPPEERSAFARVKDAVAEKLSQTAGGRVVLAMGRGGVWLFHKIEHPLLIALHKSNDLAEAAARERGLSDETAAKLKRALMAGDFFGGYATAGAALAATGSLWAAKAAAFLPSVSVAYLAYSTARNPAATWRAARSVIAGTLGTGPAAHESVTPDLAGLLADRLNAAADPEWFLALFHAALARTDGDAQKALAAADAAIRSQPHGPAE